MDKTLRGFLAGSVGGIVMSIWSIISYELGFTTFRYLDWNAVIIYGELPRGLPESIMASLMHLVLCGFLGVVFSFVLPVLSYKLHLLKGALYGMIITYFFYAVPVIFHLPHLSTIDFATHLSNTIGSIVYGIILAYLIKKIQVD